MRRKNAAQCERGEEETKYGGVSALPWARRARNEQCGWHSLLMVRMLAVTNW